MEHNQNPLTLEQLRQMDGQPVWVEDFLRPERSAWRLIYWDRGKYFVLIAKTEIAYLLDEYGKTWAAYACKSIDVDKWEPCPYCVGKICATCKNHLIPNYFEPCCSCVRGCLDGKDDLYEPLDFCSECGRPLRPNARMRLEKRIMEG